MNMVLPDYIYLTPEHETQLRRLGEVTIYDDIPSEEEAIARIAGAEIIIPGWVKITENVIRGNPSLKCIIVPGVGYDYIDLKAANAAGVRVVNCPKHNLTAVAEYTFALIFAVSRQLVSANIALKNGKWDTQSYVGTELSGKKLCLVGYGNIGRKVAQLATGFGMDVSHANSKTPPDQLDELIANADILSLHLPATTQSKYLIDERRLNLMKKSAYIVNTARGAIINQKALLTVLKSGGIAGAALDVFEDEPMIGTPNEEIMELIQLNNVVATPHIAYNTEETAFRLGEELIESIQAYVNGAPINVVNNS